MVDDLELRAARIVEKKLVGRWVKHDTGEQQGQYDFKIILPDGSFAALEVTQSLDKTLAELRAAMDEHGSSLSSPKIRRRWFLLLADKRIRLRPLMNEVRRYAPDILSSLESQGIEIFGYHVWPAVARPLQEMGIRCGICSSGDMEAEGFVEILEPPQSGAIGPALVVRCALIEACKEDNLKKLRQARDAIGRHLFVWVRQGLPSLALDHGLPEDSIELPEPITTLWIGGSKNGVLYVWRIQRNRQWELISGEGAG